MKTMRGAVLAAFALVLPLCPAAADPVRLAAWDDPDPAPAVDSARTPADSLITHTAPSDTSKAITPAPLRPDVPSVAPAAEPTPPAAPPSAPEAQPALILLPMSAGPGTDTGSLAQASAGLRLGLAESGRFSLLTQEAADETWPGGHLPDACFAARCLARAAAAAPVPLVLASDFSLRDGQWVLRLVLAQAPDGRIRRGLQVWAKASPGGLIPFAREAGWRLTAPDRQGGVVDGALFATGAWRSIPWLNPKDSIDHRARMGWAGAGLLAAGSALAYAQGQLTGADRNSTAPARALGSASGSVSYLRGFFASPALGARYAAMGGAGVAAVSDGVSLLMNPAGVAGTERENLVMAKRSLPDGTPSFFVAYAGPWFQGWHEGLGAHYEGDGLANETTLFGTLACDLGTLGSAWEGVRAGAQVKLYLAQAGESGTGLDRSTGHSYGMGIDLGLQAPLSERITAALSVRDAYGFLRHQNTFTDRSYGETLPIEWKIGAAYRAEGGLTLLLDGQKGIWADQADHLRVGGEETLWDFLALRGGLHETFGRETVRAIAVGFGLDTGGLKEARREAGLKVRLSLDYAYEFGLDEDAPLAGGQQFSLEAGF